MFKCHNGPFYCDVSQYQEFFVFFNKQKSTFIDSFAMSNSVHMHSVKRICCELIKMPAKVRDGINFFVKMCNWDPTFSCMRLQQILLKLCILIEFGVINRAVMLVFV